MISAFDPLHGSNADEKVVQAKLTTHEKIEALNCILTKNMWDNSSGMISTLGSCLGRVLLGA